MQTTALAGCTAAPSGYPVRLLYYINDGVLSDNGGAWTIRTDVYRATPAVVVGGVQQSRRAYRPPTTPSRSSQASGRSFACSSATPTRSCPWSPACERASRSRGRPPGTHRSFPAAA